MAVGNQQSIEHRVDIVEKELSILKTQIQTILLEIQEHILDRRYPSLHSHSALGVSEHHESAQRPVQSFSLRPESEGQTDTGNDFPHETTHGAPFNSPAPEMVHIPPFISSSPEDYGYEEEPPVEPRKAIESLLRKQLAPQPSTPDVTTWIELDKWVSQKVKEVGIDATRELVRLYGGEERALLLKFVNIYDDCAEPQKPIRTPLAVKPPQFQAPPPHFEAPPEPPPVQRETPPPSVVEQWQKHLNPDRVREATYRPFGEHQELVLRLLADVMNAPREPDAVPVRSNGHIKR